MATYSREVCGKMRRQAPPFSDGCPRCRADVAVVPYATSVEGDSLTAFYRHRGCGHQWSCRWSARWSDTWRAA